CLRLGRSLWELIKRIASWISQEAPSFSGGSRHTEGLPTSQTLLPEHLKKEGYMTGWIGKWHLGAAPEHSPLRRGFDEGYGFLGGGHRYQSWKENPKQEYLLSLERDGKPVEEPTHLTEAFGREASAFVRKHAQKPWFLYLAFNAPHTPNEPTPERLARFASITDIRRRRYAAQVSLMDDAIGEVRKALRESGQEKNTLVIFFSDNGGPIGEQGNGSINTPLRGGKGSHLEGGVRVPFVLSYPGTLPPGATYAQPVSSLDVFATALALAQLPFPTDKPYDSVNLLPYLTNKRTESPHETLFWHNAAGAVWAVRQGHYKLIHTKTGPDQLYDLDSDPGETSDLAQKLPEKVAELTKRYRDWSKDMAPPAFKGLGGKK
ncbi:sulfatase-like hydrolase/transferase, partial [Armatimonas sp.]|uniref:sulfatase-like hydrolase/transferase n=1 Tax=Armatimonas sp. TaxID=1872638 RepID=UPI003750204D